MSPRLEKAVMDRELEGLPREMVDSSLGTLDTGEAHTRGHSNPEQGLTGLSSDDYVAHPLGLLAHITVGI